MLPGHLRGCQPGAQEQLRAIFIRLTRLDEAGQDTNRDPDQHRDTRQRLPVTALLLAVALWLWTASEQARQDADQARLTTEVQGRAALRQVAINHLTDATNAGDTDPLMAAHSYALAAWRFDQAGLIGQSDNALLGLKLINDRPRLAAVMEHRAAIQGAQLSGNGTRILTWSEDGTARFWDAANGSLISPSLGHDPRVGAPRLDEQAQQTLPA